MHFFYSKPMERPASYLLRQTIVIYVTELPEGHRSRSAPYMKGPERLRRPYTKERKDFKTYEASITFSKNPLSMIERYLSEQACYKQMSHHKLMAHFFEKSKKMPRHENGHRATQPVSYSPILLSQLIITF
ncbi:hypothetical protein SAMN04487970_106321 [Paenibacillus tianmuensis]|uniref:Uncharacterized protein n=1 Tax=Paenibacillus tianmuensis TaxID=624147 RepID=A0A1G4TRC4_9BACL|nr:hypothetical protein SAMN04487970_106321 [Paenibacillus tianmuensis]